MRDLGFVLYGGTAIALRLGHRHSVDFFTHLPLERAALKKSLPWLATAAVLQDEPESLTVLSPGGVKVSFFGGLNVGRVGEPPSHLLRSPPPLVAKETVNTLSPVSVERSPDGF